MITVPDTALTTFMATEAGRSDNGVVATVHALAGETPIAARVVALADPDDRQAFRRRDCCRHAGIGISDAVHTTEHADCN